MKLTLPNELSHLLDAPDDDSQRAAWEEFVEKHSLLLLNAARSRGGGYDVVMDRYAFVLDRLRDEDFMWLRSYALKPCAKFRTWLAVVACRLCTDHHWSQYRQGQGDEGEEIQQDDVARQWLAEAILGTREPGVLARTGRQLTPPERLARLNRAMQGLSNRDRFLLAMRFETDASESEIAAVMALRSSYRVRKRLKQVQSVLRHDLQRLNSGAGPA